MRCRVCSREFSGPSDLCLACRDTFASEISDLATEETLPGEDLAAQPPSLPTFEGKYEVRRVLGRGAVLGTGRPPRQGRRSLCLVRARTSPRSTAG